MALAQQSVDAVGLADALIIESLNATKLLGQDRRRAVTERVVESAVAVDLGDVTDAAESIGARNSSRELVVDILLRAPLHAPRVVWQQLTLSPGSARFWAYTHNVAYRSPQQILWVRIRRMMRRRGDPPVRNSVRIVRFRRKLDE